LAKINLLEFAPPSEVSVITGPPSSGISATADALYVRRYAQIKEVARTVIDERMAAGETIEQIRGTPHLERLFQSEVFFRKLQIEIDMSLNDDYLKPTFMERGLHGDSLAYMWLQDADLDRSETYLHFRYKEIFLLDPLPTFTADYARVETPAQVTRISYLLLKAYKFFGYDVINVPALDENGKILTPDERAIIILKTLNYPMINTVQE
jgi:predicted ATPase